MADEVKEYIDLIFDTVDKINDGFNSPKDKESGERLKALLIVVTLGKYLKDRFDQELMDILEMYNQGKQH